MDQISAKLIERNRLSETVFEIKFTKPDSFFFTPGQRISLSYNNEERDYSLISVPRNSYLQICVKEVLEGKLSPALRRAKIGEKLSFKGPYGYFSFKPSARHPVFVAAGTGIAPFVSMAAYSEIRFTLLHGVKESQDLYYQAFFRSKAASYVPCLSQDQPPTVSSKDVFYGRVTEYLKSRFKPGAYDFYICGGSSMVRDVTHIIDERFPGSRVYTEAFG